MQEERTTPNVSVGNVAGAHNAGTEALRVFMPGVFAALDEEIRALFAAAAPHGVLDFHPFIPSGLLMAAIRGGSPADIFVSANRAYMHDLRAAGQVRSWRVLAGNRLCIVARPNDPLTANITSLADLVDTPARVVVPQSSIDPCGQYVVQLFERTGLRAAMAARAARGTLVTSRGSRALPGMLFDGRADVGIIYQSEAMWLGERVRLVELPPEQQLSDEIAFTIAVLLRGARTHPLAMPFVNCLLSPAGQEMLTAHGFLPPPANVAAVPPVAPPPLGNAPLGGSGSVQQARSFAAGGGGGSGSGMSVSMSMSMGMHLYPASM